jgi:hypothetical protein
MSTKKMSYVVAVENAIKGEINEETIERLTALKASLEKRASRKSEGPTKAQKANAELANHIADAMVSGEVYDTEGIKGLVEELASATPQKISPLMKHLTEAGLVITEKVKGKNTYHLA